MAAIGIYQTETKKHPIEAHRPTLSRQELEGVLDCLIKDRLSPGTITRRFEKAVASTLGIRHAISVNSATSAYHLAYLALGVQAGDRIVLSALAPTAAADAAALVGAELCPVDVARDSFHPEPEALKTLLAAALEPEQQTIVILDHTFGSRSPLTINELRQAASGTLKVIEEFTGLFGVEEGGVFFGSHGDIAIAASSDRDLITTGNGAMLLTADAKLYQSMLGSCYGEKRDTSRPAFDYRLEDFQAAIGLEQLARLGSTLARRRKIGQKYIETLRLTRHQSYFRTPTIDAFLRFPVIASNNNDEVQRYFAALQIGVERSHPAPIHHLCGRPRLEFPNAERIYQKSVTIPLYPSLTANNVERIASSLRGLI